MYNLDDLYNKAVKISGNLIEDIRFSRNISLEPIMACSDQICQFMNTNTNIFSLLNTVQDKCPYLYSHPVNVAFISYVIGKWMYLSSSELSQLVCAGLLHDVGKAKVRDSILNKPEKLSDMEMEAVRLHPVTGYKILENLDGLDPNILLGVLSHHERQNGSGYPRRQWGDQISKFGKIIAIADIYDAMTSKRPYSDKATPFKAIEEIQKLSFEFLDPQICQTFLNNIINFYYGSVVRLNNERVGEIVYLNPEERTKPVIHCDNDYINLNTQRDIEIVEML
jgi:HD-GYP domain-containing protein (c-di-GMP phosphodiesterase class II)